jgi:serine/threonine protein kinase
MRKYQEEGKHFSEDKVWKLLKDLVLGLKEIHKNKKGVILHRNIQPKSLFISNNSIKLGNFKFVKKLDT